MNTDPQYGVSVYPPGECISLRHRLFVDQVEAERFYKQELSRLKDLQEYWGIELWRSIYHPGGAGVISQAEYKAGVIVPVVSKPLEEQGRLW